MPKFFVNQLGTIREASKLFVNDSGVVRELTRLWALDGNTPRLVFELVQGLPPVSGPTIGGLSNSEQQCVSDFSIPPGSILAIPANFWAWSDNTAEPGLCVDVANVTVINGGNIIGKGGQGGGNDGGPALEITACGVTVINSSGAFIAGGGGGGQNVTTNLGRGWSAGGGGGAGGGNGGNSSGGAGSAGSAIGTGPAGGGLRGAGSQTPGQGGGRMLPGNTTPGADGSGNGGGWAAAGGSGLVGRSTRAGGVGGPAIISSTIWNGVTNDGTIYGQVAPLIGSDVPHNSLFHHQEVTLSSLCVEAGSTFTIPEDFWFWSDDRTVAALTIDVNNVTVINNGNIIGRGGNGGSSVGGEDGGPAINITATGVTINNTSSGHIFGGGGGGRGRVVNRGRGTSNGGGGGAGGGFGGAGSSSNSRATIGLPRGIGETSINGVTETGGPGNSGTNYGVAGGRVVPGAAYTPAAGGGGGWGQGGLDTNGNPAGAAGVAITGNSATIINNGDIRGGIANSLSGSCIDRQRSPRGCSTTIPFSGTVPAGAQWSINVNSSGSSDPLKTGSLVFDGVTVATFSAGAGGTPGSFFRNNSYTGTGTITGGPYTPTTVTFNVSGAGTSLPGTSNAHIGGSVSVTWIEDAPLPTGTFLSETYTSSGTVSLTGTGPGWVFLTGGGGSGGAFIHVTTQPQAGPGGAGGTAGMFLPDLSVINGATFTLGAGGAGRNANGSGNDSNPGNAGATSSFSGGGVTLSATGGGGGGEINFAAGAAGVGTPALDPQVARDYWAGFLVDDGSGNMVSGDTRVAVGGGNGGAAANLVSPAGIFASITSGAGGGGQLTIIYQDQS